MSTRFFGLTGLLALGVLLLAPPASVAQLDQTAAWASHVSNEYRVVPNVTIPRRERLREQRRSLSAAQRVGPVAPVLMYIHGGGWVGGSKGGQRPAAAALAGEGLGGGQRAVPDSARISRAPAAVEGLPLRVALGEEQRPRSTASMPRASSSPGTRAGGHLALTTGMVPGSAGLDLECQPKDDLGVAAIINWYGITDVGDLLHGREREVVRGAPGWAACRTGSTSPRRVVAAQLRPGRPAAGAHHSR